MKQAFEIESDCLDIIKRLKEIDEDYFVKFEPSSQTFQLHNRSQKKNTFCLAFPFDTLDERAIDLTLKTRVQNSDEIFREIEESNRELEISKTKQILNDFKEQLYDC